VYQVWRGRKPRSSFRLSFGGAMYSLCTFLTSTSHPPEFALSSAQARPKCFHFSEIIFEHSPVTTFSMANIYFFLSFICHNFIFHFIFHIITNPPSIPSPCLPFLPPLSSYLTLMPLPTSLSTLAYYARYRSLPPLKFSTQHASSPSSPANYAPPRQTDYSPSCPLKTRA
jgi:hypothetical protein